MNTKKRNSLLIGMVVITTIVLITLLGEKVVADETYTVQVGEFESTVSSQGEMKSQHYQKINMPEVMVNPELNIYQLKINDLVEEGTIIKKGEYVGTLDQERIKSELNRNRDRLENYQNKFKMSTIDSTTSLTNMRNQIQELQYDLEYKELEMKQSIYESSSYQDKIKRSYDRAIRKLEMTQRNYQREEMKYSSRCNYNERNVKDTKKRVEKLNLAIQKSRIMAPTDGMIIYATVHGRKRKIGDHVSFWSPEIAVLPDLSKLVSEGYIEEIHISKVHIGDQVRVKVDALSDKAFTGEVVSISNIGKTVNGVDSKVFDIKVRINENDKDISHGMNTSNEIITHYSKDDLVIPLDYVFMDNIGTLVYLKTAEGFVKQYITISYTNDELALIGKGLSAGDVISTVSIEQ